MDKLIFISYIIATVTIPIIGARKPLPKKGFAWTLGAMAIAAVVYAFLVLKVAINYISLTL